MIKLINKNQIKLKQLLIKEWSGLVDDIKKLKYKKTWYYLINYLFIIFLSCIITGIGVYFFAIPAKLGNSGFTGISILLHYNLGFDIGKTTLLLNLPFIILGFPILGRKFVLNAIVGLYILKLGLNIAEPLKNLTAYHPNDPWLSVIYGGILIGLGVGTVLKMGSNTGGTDIIALLNYHFTKIKLSHTILVFDTCVILTSLYFLKFQIGMYTLVHVFIYSIVIRLIIKSKVNLLINIKKTQPNP